MRKFWKSFARWFKYICKLEVELSNSIILLNNYKGDQSILINTAILIAKQYLYACSCKVVPIQYCEFVARLHDMYMLEKNIALEENVYQKHVTKWKSYIDNAL